MNVSREILLRLAADTGLDPRTIRRAIEKGLRALRAEVDRERLREAAKKLGVNIKN